MTEAAPASPVCPFRLAVVMERVCATDRWRSEKWEVKGVVRDNLPEHSAEQVLRDDGDTKQILFPGVKLELNAVEAEGYLLNITSPQPKIFVLWRLEDGDARPERMTVSYHEGARGTDCDENVDGVPLPAELIPWIAEYAAAHYRPEPKRKPRYASSKDKGVASRRDG